MHCPAIQSRPTVRRDAPPLGFSIERELTEEWWFIPAVILVMLLLLGALMYLFFLYHFKQNLKVQAMRIPHCRRLHDEVGATPLEQHYHGYRIAWCSVSSAMPRKCGPARQYRADSKIRSIIRTTVWTINPDNDAPEKLFEKMRSIAFQMLAVREIRVEFENAIRNVNSFKIGIDQRRDILPDVQRGYEQYCPAFGGAACDGADQQVGGEVSALPFRTARASFDPVKPVEGNGLRNFRNRAASSFIDFAIDSAPGKGTRISMIVPELEPKYHQNCGARFGSPVAILQLNNRIARHDKVVLFEDNKSFRQNLGLFLTGSDEGEPGRIL